MRLTRDKNRVAAGRGAAGRTANSPFPKILKYLYGQKDLPEGTGLAMLTAWNPHGKKLSEDKPENRRLNRPRQKELFAELQRRGLVFWKQVGSYGSPEDSVVILGIPKDEALALGRRFGQESVAFAEREGDRMVYRLIFSHGEVMDRIEDVEMVVKDAANAEDYYSAIPHRDPDDPEKKVLRKYRIPFDPGNADKSGLPKRRQPLPPRGREEPETDA